MTELAFLLVSPLIGVVLALAGYLISVFVGELIQTLSDYL